MKTLISILVLISIQNSLTQEIHWDKTKNWKLYDIHDDNAFQYSLDTLKHFKCLKLDDSTMHNYLKQAVTWPKEKKSLWMGLYVTTCEIENGKTRKIDISVYGGFFFDEKEKTYYALPTAIKDDWLQYIHDLAGK